MIDIQPKPITTCRVSVPGSKSHTHRLLITTALSDGLCTIRNGLESEDTRFTIEALKQMGVTIDTKSALWRIHGAKGKLSETKNPIYLGNSGTSMRLLTAVAALGTGDYVLSGTDRMHERPIHDLVTGLKDLGVSIKTVRENGCPPVIVHGAPVSGGNIGLCCKTSSQFLSGILLIAPYTQKGVDVTITEGPVSKPYIDLTVKVMAACGVEVERHGYERFIVEGGQTYRPGDYSVEADCSQAGYFWGAAAITGGTVTVIGASPDSSQGDVKFAHVLEKMGCRVKNQKEGISVSGADLTGIKVDMGDMPDMVPTLAVVAAFANGTTEIENVTHLKEKESDRLGSVVAELNKMGINAHCTDSGMTVVGGTPHGAEINTYNDHRMAMSFAMAGLKVPGVRILDERCVDKSFPNFWRVFEGLS